MLKKILPVFIILLFISSTFIGTVQAQSGPSKDKQTWRCLKAEQVGGKTKKPPKEVDIKVTGPKNEDLRFPTDINSYDGVYIVFVIPPKSQKNKPPDKAKTVQSTGNTDFDDLLFGKDFTEELTKRGIELKIPSDAAGQNEKIKPIDGRIDITVHLTNAQGHTNYRFFGVTRNEDITTAPTQTSQESGSTLQYGTFDFGSSNTGDPEDCESIRWDPYGRVFDSRSLEPIPDVKVKLLDENKELFAGFDFPIPNPQVTESDGMFNFPVPPGTYYLTVPGKPSTHEFTSNLIEGQNLHKNYKKAYSNLKDKSELYKPDEPIIEERDKPVHRDIALDPGSNLPLHFPVVIITYDTVKMRKSTKYEGIVSHPLSKVKLVGKKTKTKYAEVNSNHQGEWEIVLPNSQIPQNEKLKIVPVKVDITKLSLKNNILQRIASVFDKYVRHLVPDISAQETDESEGQEIEVDPILPYVEGYAYDINKKVIPNAQVRVRMDWSGQVFYETEADETGFFRIEPKLLPIFAYNLEFVSPATSQSIIMTTSGFVEKNEKYLQENKINLMAVTKDEKSLYATIPPPTGQGQNISPTLVSGSTQSSNIILTVLVLVILFITAGIVFMYVMKKRDITLQNPQIPPQEPSGQESPPQV